MYINCQNLIMVGMDAAMYQFLVCQKIYSYLALSLRSVMVAIPFMIGENYLRCALLKENVSLTFAKSNASFHGYISLFMNWLQPLLLKMGL